jgi:hypothetical protein
MSQRPQPVSKHTASKHRRNTAAGRHRRITAEMQRRAELNKRRATLVKCVASVGAVAALSGGVSTAATSTLASSGSGGAPEAATAKQNLGPARIPARPAAGTGAASRSLARSLTGISGGAIGGVGPYTPSLVDPAASPMGDGPLPFVVGTGQVETATLVRPATSPTVSPKSKSATSVPKVTKVVAATAKVAKVATKTVAKAPTATTTKTTTPSGSTTKKGSGSGSTTSGTGTGSGGTTGTTGTSGGSSGGSGGSGGSAGSGSGSGSGGGTVAPPPAPPVVLSGDQPGPGNTGVPAGTALTVMNGNLTITTAGATYSGLDIHGFVKVEAPNVTIKDSIIRGGVAPSDIGLVNDTDDSATNFLIEDSELVPMDPSVQIDGIKGWNYTALRVDIHGTTDGAKMYGPNATIEDSYIHGLVTYAHDPDHGGGESHNDGVQILSGTNLKIIGNTIEGGSNTALMITQDHGTTSNVMFANNWVSGGACSINMTPEPLGSLSGISLDNNIFTDNSTKHCPILDTTHTNLNVSGNVFAGTGLPVPVNNKGAN